VGTNIAGNVRRSALSLRTADDPEPQEAQGAQVVHPAHGCGVNTETVAVLRPKGAEGERAVLRPPPAHGTGGMRAGRVRMNSETRGMSFQSFLKMRSNTPAAGAGKLSWCWPEHHGTVQPYAVQAAVRPYSTVKNFLRTDVRIAKTDLWKGLRCGSWRRALLNTSKRL
jgi:hypothetical protein